MDQPMMTSQVEILGFEYTARRKTFRPVEATAHKFGVEIRLEKASAPAKIAVYWVLSVPAVTANDTLVHSGGVPDRKRVAQWLS